MKTTRVEPVLCRFLGLRPLDRVQINDAAEILEMDTGRQMGSRDALPFFYFQRVVGGLLEVCSPNGYVTKVAPESVCDFIAGEPVMVKAMPRHKFMERSRLPVSARQTGAIGAEWYDDAYVLAVEKDRWGRPDRVWVHFVDDRLNSDARQVAPLDDASRMLLVSLSRRTRMPVISTSRGGRSADAGVAKSEGDARHLVSRFMRAALKGHQVGVDLLAMAGAKPVKIGMLNKLGVPLPSGMAEV